MLNECQALKERGSDDDEEGKEKEASVEENAY